MRERERERERAHLCTHDQSHQEAHGGEQRRKKRASFAPDPEGVGECSVNRLNGPKLHNREGHFHRELR